MIKEQQETLLKAFDLLKTDPDFSSLLGAVLSVGNYLNAGNKKLGQADGFLLDGLSKT